MLSVKLGVQNHFGFKVVKVTFDSLPALAGYVIRMRPKLTIIENVPDLGQEIKLEDGSLTSDVKFIKADLEEHGFTVYIVVISRKDYSSPHNGLRLWIVIFDILPEVGWKHEKTFNELLISMRVPTVMDLDRFLMDEDNLAKMDQATVARNSKRHCPKVDWHNLHEGAFVQCGFSWPPDLSYWPEHEQFRRREADLVHLANIVYPPTEGTKIDFFDANMSLQRALKYPGKDPEQPTSNPWRAQIPTMSGGCVIVVRTKRADGSVGMRRLHGLEAMRLQGWDLPLWRGGLSPCAAPQSASSDLLQNLAGNMWSAFHFVPIFLSAMCCMHWPDVVKETIIL